MGYGCTTCIGNSGPLPEPIAQAIDEHALVTAAVLSGNRNFEARVHPQVRANYLASPVLVVAFALAGRVDIDLDREPLGTGKDGKPVYLRDIWPSPGRGERDDGLRRSSPSCSARSTASVFDGDEVWQALPAPTAAGTPGTLNSTYVQDPPFFRQLPGRARRLSRTSPRSGPRSPG